MVYDFEPLADNAPPRYSVESDEEEDEYNPLHLSSVNPKDSLSTLSVRILGSFSKGKSVIIATGEGGKYWAKGAKLGEQTGTVQANNIEVGLVFNPSWSDATVIISEALTRLPIWGQHSYALHIIEFFEPKRLALLDTYSAPTYTSPEAIPIHDAPIRYLTTAATVKPLIRAKAQPFNPPNLIQSTSASYMSIVSTGDSTDSILILLPSARVPRPPPATILPPDISHLPEDHDRWSSDVMNVAQQLLLVEFGEEAQSKWVLADAPLRVGSPKRKTLDSLMYI
ncbi:hypothetical protein AX15_005265 [Amanita polypyramis BW_CC]|nr:hypothetical protein AX15_005265 [Amanita polypyramis BW_CC]